MAAKFKIGDKIVALEDVPNRNGLVKDREYVVLDVLDRGDWRNRPQGERYRYKVKDDGGHWFEKRFRLAEGEAMAEQREAIIAQPKAPAGKPKRVKKVWPIVVGSIVKLLSDDHKPGWHSTYNGRALIGKVMAVTNVSGRSFTTAEMDEISEGSWLDTQQAEIQLTKKGTPRKARKKAVKKQGRLLPTLLAKTKAMGAGVCYFAKELVDGSRQWMLPGPCHAQMTQYGGVKVKAVAYALAPHWRSHGDKEGYAKYVDYIIRRSPVANSFSGVKKNDKLHEGGVYANMDVSINHIMAGAVTLREGSEYPLTLAMFIRLLKEGYSEDVAFIVSRFYTGTGDDIVVRQENGHSSMTKQGDWKSLKQVFKTRKLMVHGDNKPYKEKADTGYLVYGNWACAEMRYGAKGDIKPENTIEGVFNKHAKPTITGEGFNRVSKLTFTSVKSVADFVTKELK